MVRPCSECCRYENTFIRTILEVDIITMNPVLQMRKRGLREFR